MYIIITINIICNVPRGVECKDGHGKVELGFNLEVYASVKFGPWARKIDILLPASCPTTSA